MGYKPFRTGTIVAIIIGLVLGFCLAILLNAFLGISFAPKDLPEETVPPPLTKSGPVGPLEPVAAIVLPDGARPWEAYAAAASSLAFELEARSGRRPAILESDHPRPDGRLILIGASQVPGPLGRELSSPESFLLLPFKEDGGRSCLAVVGGSRNGDVYGMYRLAEELRTGRDGPAFFGERRAFTPAFRHRIVDLGAVGVPQDPERWDPESYSHHLRAFLDALRTEPPYVDPAEWDRVRQQFSSYVRRMLSYGNNGIVIPGFLEFIDFDRVGRGDEVYPSSSEYRARHASLREAFNRLVEHAREMGLEVYLSTDMLALTPPLEAYLKARFGRLDTENPDLWRVYGAGLDELAETMPGVKGIVVRIGEAGSIYNLPGWDYTSALAVRSVGAVRSMLRAFLEAAERLDKTIVFRTWSVGVGGVGDMHIDPESYRQVLTGIDSSHLIVSTKYVRGDFYSFLPFNPTLIQDGPTRIVEFQNRLEYEGFMAFPDYIAPLHQMALRELRRRNPRIEGFWHWNQYGGPQQAGPMSLYPFFGFWLNTDANTYATSRLGWEPDLEPRELAADWVRRTFGCDRHLVASLTDMLFLSRKAVRQGLYIGPFARRQVDALGLATTPMMWILEWDILDGSQSVLSIVYYSSRERIGAAVAEGFEAVDTVGRMQRLLDGVEPASVAQPELWRGLSASLEYEADLFLTLAWYRSAFLRYYQWLDTGRAEAARDWRTALRGFTEQQAAHLARYGGDRDHPAYNFFAAEIGLAHARRARLVAWLARGLLAAFLTALLAGSGAVAGRLPGFAGKKGLRAVWLALVSPARCQPLGEGGPADRLTGVVLPLMLSTICFLAFSSFLSVQHAFLTLLMPGVMVTTMIFLDRRWPRLPWLAAQGAAFLPPAILLAAVLSVRGPGLFWFKFWTDPAWRTVFIALDGAAFAWTFSILYSVQRSRPGRSRTASLGVLLLALGAETTALAAVPALFGLEKTLTAINDEMAILPLGLSRILGMTTHLGIPPDLPVYLLGIGGFMMGIGILCFVLARKGSSGRDEDSSTTAEAPSPLG